MIETLLPILGKAAQEVKFSSSGTRTGSSHSLPMFVVVKRECSASSIVPVYKLCSKSSGNSYFDKVVVLIHQRSANNSNNPSTFWRREPRRRVGMSRVVVGLTVPCFGFVFLADYGCHGNSSGDRIHSFGAAAVRWWRYLERGFLVYNSEHTNCCRCDAPHYSDEVMQRILVVTFYRFWINLILRLLLVRMRIFCFPWFGFLEGRRSFPSGNF